MIPIVSAIGHEADKPLLDDIADVRASTPTDAAKRIVPDVGEERHRIADARARLLGRLQSLVDGETDRLRQFRERPVLASPVSVVDSYAEDILRLVQRGVDVTDTLVELARTRLDGLRASMRALSPQSTLDRGYAIVQDDKGDLVDSVDDVSSGDRLRVRVRDGDIGAVVGDS